MLNLLKIIDSWLMKALIIISLPNELFQLLIFSDNWKLMIQILFLADI